ncbi:hypothetical protein ABW20_dc0105509 [Dactylellina cionopaga]|nr:hypothetical protein ABW20_dc0105509 [Dactylellina cionopaga]
MVGPKALKIDDLEDYENSDFGEEGTPQSSDEKVTAFLQGVLDNLGPSAQSQPKPTTNPDISSAIENTASNTTADSPTLTSNSSESTGSPAESPTTSINSEASPLALRITTSNAPPLPSPAPTLATNLPPVSIVHRIDAGGDMEMFDVDPDNEIPDAPPLKRWRCSCGISVPCKDTPTRQLYEGLLSPAVQRVGEQVAKRGEVPR